MSDKPVRVLVVDDSAFARKVLREVLSASALVEVVGTARDGLDALEKITELDPDVVTLDLVMPSLDGLGLLRTLAGRARPRVLVVSMSDANSDLAIEALALGAVDVVHKPTALATDRLYELSEELTSKVVAIAPPPRAQPRPSMPGPVSTRDGSQSRRPRAELGARAIVAIGASTGGPQALTKILSALPGGFPVPVVVALHMPVGYTEALSKRLNGVCAIEVLEASDGLELRPGRAIVARAGMHLKLVGGLHACRAKLDFLPMTKPHRPSVDVLFESVAEVYGRLALAVVLTGMGDDGLLGAGALCRAGSVVLTEAESSCIVYGMPRTVVEAGLSNEQVPLDEMAAAILRRFGRHEA